MNNGIREITPIGDDDFFVVLDQSNFKFPLHFHPEYEINMVQHFDGIRTVGDSVEKVNAPDMVFIGPNVRHAWHGRSVYAGDHKMITIQFREDLFSESFMDKNLFRPIKEMMTHASKGVKFSQETITSVIPKLISMTRKKNFDSVLDFFSILHELSISKNMQTLCETDQNMGIPEIKSRRINTVHNYLQDNLHRKISVDEVAALVNMTKSGFCHFFKRRTQKSFVDFLSDLRIAKASRMLIDSSKTILEIAFECGFNNISNFNRVFKNKKGITPSQYRETNKNTLTLY